MSTPILTAVRSAKGGNGATTVALALAVMVAEQHKDGLVLLVSRDGVHMAGTSAPTSNLLIERSVSYPVTRFSHIIYDVETGEPFPPDCQDYIIVMRQCYLSVKHAVTAGVPENACVQTVIITEPGRALRCEDVDAAMGFEHSADMVLDPTVARAVDAGLMCARLPHSLRVGLRPIRDSICWAG